MGLPLWDRLTFGDDRIDAAAGVNDSEGTILIPEVGDEDLAEMIGCSRPMVSPLIEMVESGLLARRGMKYVLLKKWYFGSDDLALSFIKRRDRRCRKCFSKRYGSAAGARKAKVKK